MTDTPNQGHEPILTPQDPPEHGSEFWANLDSALGDATSTPPMVVGDRDRTASLPPVHAPDAPVVALRSRRTLWPLAVAASVLLVAGLGFVAMRNTTDSPLTTEVVAGESTVAQIALSDGVDDNSAGSSTSSDAANEPQDDATQDEGLAGGDPQPADATTTEPQAASPPNSDNPAATTTPVSGTGDTPPAPPIPDFDAALGAIGDPVNLPLDQGLPADSDFLASWGERGVTWYAVTNDNSNCARADYSEIRFVNGSGITQDVRDPQLTFSGEVSHFVVRPEKNQAAWLVACGTQLEMYVAALEPDGHIESLDLVWLGEGSNSTALVLWDESEVSVNAIEPDGKAFAVSYDLESKLLSRNGGPSRIMLEAGAPAERSLTPLAATPDGGLTYWAGRAPAGTVSACRDLFGSGVSDTLWLRQGEGQWQLATAEVPLGSVTAAAIEAGSSQIAFADLCVGQPGRVQVGTQEPDGRISDLREIDLAPYVPGYVAQLHWVDADTLRIETDNTEFGFDTVRFDYRLGETAQDGLIVQLD